MGHRKPYILIGLALQGVTMLVLANVSPVGKLGGFVILALIASIGMALYDTCTDGLALDTTPQDERGLVQGVMVGGRAAGILVMLLAGGQIAQTLGWPWVFYGVGLLALLPMPLVWQVKEIPAQMHRSAFKAFRQTCWPLPGSSTHGIYTFLSDHLRDVIEVSISNVGLWQW